MIEYFCLRELCKERSSESSDKRDWRTRNETIERSILFCIVIFFSNNSIVE